jgi:hypothetical protein
MVFGSSGTCYVQDNGGMTMTYVFDFTPSAVQYGILSQSGVLAHPTGVLVNISTPTDNVLTSEAGNTPPNDPLTTETGVYILVTGP